MGFSGTSPAICPWIKGPAQKNSPWMMEEPSEAIMVKLGGYINFNKQTFHRIMFHHEKEARMGWDGMGWREGGREGEKGKRKRRKKGNRERNGKGKGKEGKAKERERNRFPNLWAIMITSALPCNILL